MGRLFGQTLGQSGRVRGADYQAIPSLVSVDGLFNNDVVLLSGVGFSQKAGVQYMQSLSRVIYVYVFGERMGRVRVSGVALWNPCSGRAGLSEVLKYYKRNSVSFRDRTVDVSIGASQAISGFVDGVQTTFQSAESGAIGFVLDIATTPDMWE